MNCTTHFHACDCREDYFKKRSDYFDRLEKAAEIAIKTLIEMADFDNPMDKRFLDYPKNIYLETARKAIQQIEEILDVPQTEEMAEEEKADRDLEDEKLDGDL